MGVINRQMKKKKVIAYEYYAEKLALFSDIDKNVITNERAKYVLAYCFKIPSWLQTHILNQMCDFNLLKRENQRILKVKSKNEVFD